MRRFLAFWLTTLSLLAASAASASFHLWSFEQFYSNADGSVQFVVMSTTFSGENFLGGHMLTSNGSGGPKSFTFPNDLPGNTMGKKLLIGTTGFAALGVVAPDYTVPNGFFSLTGGSVSWPFGEMFSYTALPTDGVNSLYRDGSVSPNFATNYAGQTGSVQAAAPVLNFQGIWWGAPAGSESGWGINLAHQSDTIFASWFTYDPAGRAWWAVMTAQKIGPNTYQGQLFETTGPAFDAVPWLAGNVVAKQIGMGTLTFADANTGSFSYTVDKGGLVTQTKQIVRQVFGPLPTCTFGAQLNLTLATNFQDLWWKFPATTESGWGINFNHEGDTIFATWFTYDHDGDPLWLVVTAPKTAPGVYSGDLYRTTGPPFSAMPFNPALVMPTKVGTATFTFADGNNATFAYTVQLADMMSSVTQAKAVTREVFVAPGTVCR
jgi:hypothetical protein